MAESLGALENTVLEALSRAAEPMSVRDVQECLQPTSELAYTTVLTVLDRLHEKKLVRREKRGRAFYYQPRITAEEWRGQRAAKLLGGRDAPPTRAVLMAFLDGAERVSPDVLHELSLLIEKRRQARKKQ